MSFSLIREAHLKTTLSPEQIDLLETVKTVLGKDSLVSVSEWQELAGPPKRRFAPPGIPDQEDFSTWLDVIRGYARDNKININKKNDFFDVAGAVLENDPTNPPHSMHKAIMNKLWLDHRAQRHMDTIGKVAQAAEDEERVAQAARTMIDVPDDPDTEYSDSKYPDSEYSDTEYSDTDGGNMDGVDEYSDPRDAPASDMESEQAWWHGNQEDDGGDDEFGLDDEDDTDPAAFPRHIRRQNQDLPNDLNGVPEEDNFDPGDEFGDEFGNDFGDEFESNRNPRTFESLEDYPRLAFGQRDWEAESEMNPHDTYLAYRAKGGRLSRQQWEEDRAMRNPWDRDSVEDEEKTAKPKQMSMLQHMLSLPKNSMNTLVKDVEEEGAAAWTQHALPQNPHPKGSLAFNAWERGLKKAMKDCLGLTPPPAKKPIKKTTKKR